MIRSLAFLSFGVFAAACASSDPFSTSPPSSGGASGAEVDRCKQSCDKMKFFDCSTAEEQARCYADCDKATPSQVQVFTGCATSSICDPACRTTIQPKDAPASQGTGATASTCSSACDKLVSCSFIPVGKKSACVSECTTKGYQYQIDCVNKAACENVQSTCGGVTGAPGATPPVNVGDAGGFDLSIVRCEAECDSINLFECASAEAHASCRAKCTSAAAPKRDTFTSCGQSSSGDCERKKGCLDAFLK